MESTRFLMNNYQRTGGEDYQTQQAHLEQLRNKPLRELSENDLGNLIYNYVQNLPFRTYHLSTSSDELKFDTTQLFTYYVLGCQGNAGENQHLVAQGLDHQIAEDKNNQPVVFLTGDSAYDNGIKHPSELKKFFDDIYLKYPHLKKAKFFAIGGNHDANIHKLNLFKESGDKILLNQVAYTYLLKLKSCNPNLTFNQALLEVDQFFNKKVKHPKTNEEVYILPIDQLPAWNMFNLAYSVVAGDIEFFCLNSNNLAEHIFDLFNPDDNSPSKNNQAEFFVKAYKQAEQANRKLKGLMIHHPPSTVGGRAYSNDFEMYCPDKEKRLAILKFLGLDPVLKHSNNEVIDVALQKLCKKWDMHVDFINTAHDHNIYLLESHLKGKENNYYDRLVCSGGGGGHLQRCKFFGSQEHLGIFLPKHGFVKSVCDQVNAEVKSFLFTLKKIKNERKITKRTYEFAHQSIKPHRIYPAHVSQEEQSRIEKLCEVTKRALDKYFLFIHERQEYGNNEVEGHEKTPEQLKNIRGKFLSKKPIYGNWSHGDDGVERAIKLWDYISKREADDFITTLNKIHQISQWRPNSFVKMVSKAFQFFGTAQPKEFGPSHHSLIQYLDKEFNAEYNKGKQPSNKLVNVTEFFKQNWESVSDIKEPIPLEDTSIGEFEIIDPTQSRTKNRHESIRFSNFPQ